MRSNQIIIANGTLREIGAFLLLSRRAHLLTTAKTLRVLAVVVFQHSLKPCALRGVRLRWSLADSDRKLSPSVRLSLRQPHRQSCITALTAWVFHLQYPSIAHQIRNTFDPPLQKQNL